jgi:RNA polymerase sigma factor (sigma-70 family)
METEELEGLVGKARAGDLEAYGRIVRRFQDMAYGYAYSRLGDFHLAEDAAQEAFIQAYRRLVDLKTPKGFAGWFRRIVVTVCLQFRRRKRVPTPPLTDAQKIQSEIPGPDQAAETREMGVAVLHAVQNLPEHQRAVTTLFYINGYSEKDISEFLEVPITTVKKRLHDSRSKLKERMVGMVKKEVKKHSLSGDFTQKVLTLVELMEAGVGKYFKFEFANGVRVYTRVDRVVRDEKQFHFLLCGPTDILCHGKEEVHVDSFVIIPSTVVTVAEIWKRVDPRLQAGQHPPIYGVPESDAAAYIDKGMYGPMYEIVRPEGSLAVDEKKFCTLPDITGPLDIINDAPPHAFGFIRVGKKKVPGFKDIYVPITLILKYHLKPGDLVKCTWRRAVGNERYRSADDVLAVNGKAPEPDGS